MEYQKLKTNLSVKEVWWAWTENRCCLITFGKQSMLVAIYHPRQSDRLWITVLIHFYLVSILDKNYYCWWVTIIFLTNKVAFSVSILLKNVDMTDFLKNRNNTIIWMKEHSHHNGSLNRVWFMLPLTYCTITAYLQHSQVYRHRKHETPNCAEPRLVLNHQLKTGIRKRWEEGRTVNLCEFFYFIFKIMN